MNRTAHVVALALGHSAPPGGALSCQHPLVSLPCLLVWLSMSVPFVAGGGLYSLLALRRRRLGAPSRIALLGSIGFGFGFAFLTATALAYLLDTLHVTTTSFVLEVAEYLLWVLVWQTLYVRLVIRLWVWLWGK